MVLEALRRARFVQKDAAALLRVSRRKLNYMIRRMGITHPTWRRNRSEAGSPRRGARNPVGLPTPGDQAPGTPGAAGHDAEDEMSMVSLRERFPTWRAHLGAAAGRRRARRRRAAATTRRACRSTSSAATQYLKDEPVPRGDPRVQERAPDRSRTRRRRTTGWRGRTSASKQAQQAYWELQETVRLDPKNLDARLEYAQFLLLGEEGRARGGDQAGRRGDAPRTPDRLAALLLKGRALQSLERYDEARAVYEKAIEKAPKDAAPLLLLATLHRERGELANAPRSCSASSPRSRPASRPTPRSRASSAPTARATPRPRRSTARRSRRPRTKEKAAAYAALANFYYSRERYADAEKRAAPRHRRRRRRPRAGLHAGALLPRRAATRSRPTR